jgi:ribosomal protein S13
MYGKAPKMSKTKAPAKKPAMPMAPKLPVRGQRTMTNKMTRGKK